MNNTINWYVFNPYLNKADGWFIEKHAIAQARILNMENPTRRWIVVPAHALESCSYFPSLTIT